MSTIELIDAALAAKADFDHATTAASLAAATLKQAAAALKDAEQALHDDLEANGPCVVIDGTVTPPVVLIYTVADPDSYSVKEIRVAA